MWRLKTKHFRNPKRTFAVAKDLITADIEMRAFARRGKCTFANDPRYRLESVTEGFVSRLGEDSDDTVLLNRICSAYIATVEHPEMQQETYSATRWWEAIRRRSLGDVQKALMTRDTVALRNMYRNFFRDPCCAGLTAVPYGMTDAYFGARIRDRHRHVYLSDALHRLNYWKQATGGRFAISDLATPEIGNPFGIYTDNILVSARSDFQHYCSERIAGSVNSSRSTVVEIGGGFGGMAYYLLRDRPELRFLDFDVPESIALTSYYLMKAFPHKRFSLFGEDLKMGGRVSDADLSLMPLFEMKNLEDASVDVTFSSHAMNDIEPTALIFYLETISRVTRNHFIFIGTKELGELQGQLTNLSKRFYLEEIRELRWNKHRSPKAAEVECTYAFKRNHEPKASLGRA